MSTNPASIDVSELMRQIQERARQSSEDVRITSGVSALTGATALSRARFSASELREAVRHVSELPPSPPTLRGRVGLVLVGILNRLFAWQRAQSRPFQAAVVNNSDEQLRALDALSQRVEAQGQALASLTRELASLRLSARQDHDRLAGLLAEEVRRREEFEAGCRSSLNHLEHETARRNS